MEQGGRPRAQTLVVDDDQSMCDLIAASLTERGYDTVCETDFLAKPPDDEGIVGAGTGKELLAALASSRERTAARFDVRVVMATNGDLEGAVETGPGGPFTRASVNSRRGS